MLIVKLEGVIGFAAKVGLTTTISPIEHRETGVLAESIMLYE